jgi:Cell division protein FtsI/penicillin-binding protein 2
MLETVTAPGGTSPDAAVPGYRVGGKSGTAYKHGAHGYDHSKYRASFVGMAPMPNPRIVVPCRSTNRRRAATSAVRCPVRCSRRLSAIRCVAECAAGYAGQADGRVGRFGACRAERTAFARNGQETFH